MTFPSTQQSGFSLVETLVAITILLIIIVGPMTISSSTAQSTSFSSEQVVAFFLAQEGAELAQKARDDLLVPSFLPSTDPDYLATPWTDFVDDSLSGEYRMCFDSSGCALEVGSDAAGTVATIERCSTVNSCRLYYDTTGDRTRYTHDDGGGANERTPYTRIVQMEQAGDEVAVTSRVFWRTGSQRQAQEVVVQTYLFDIYDN